VNLDPDEEEIRFSRVFSRDGLSGIVPALVQNHLMIMLISRKSNACREIGEDQEGHRERHRNEMERP